MKPKSTFEAAFRPRIPSPEKNHRTKRNAAEMKSFQHLTRPRFLGVILFEAT